MDALNARIAVYVAVVIGFVGLSFVGLLPVGDPLWILGLVGVIALSYPLIRGGVGGGKLLQTGVPASAVVLGIRETGVELGFDIVLRFDLQVEPAGQVPYRTTTTSRLARTELSMVPIGRRVEVKVDPAKPEQVAIDWARSNGFITVP
jgi:hypothetical protein